MFVLMSALKKGRNGGGGVGGQGKEQTGIIQLVERPTEKPGAILTRVRVPDASRDFSPRVNFQCRLSYGGCTALVCSRMNESLCAR